MTLNKAYPSQIFCSLALCLCAVVGYAQPNNSLSSTPSGYPVDADGAEIHLTAEPHAGDLTITGANITLVLDPGEHTVSGNVTINAAGDRILVGWNKEKQPGSLKVGGTLTLGPENAPALALDLSLVGNFTVGETFAIMSAGSIEGHFSGLDDGNTFEMDDARLRINYSDNNIIITVLAVPKRWDRNNRERTPVIEIDNSLINPTSTAPSFW